MTRNNQNNKRQSSVPGVVVFLFILMNIASVSIGATVLECSNGITARIYAPQEIENDWLVKNSHSTLLHHPSVGTVELLNGTDDERLGLDVAQFHTYNEDLVVSALTDIHGFRTNLNVDIFILPSMPVAPMSSFATKNVIFLAPGIGPVAESTQAYTLTHEMGHVLTWAFLDNSPARWETFLLMRGIDILTAGYSAPHADRAREIIAEDFRYLFGGALATETGTIENRFIALPDEVPGLAETLISFVEEPVADAGLQFTSRAFPNPCNPLTKIEMAFPVGLRISTTDGAQLRIFDISGRLVRTMAGGELANNRIAIEWDSTTDNGARVPSGTYLFVISIGQISSQGRITVIR